MIAALAAALIAAVTPSPSPTPTAPPVIGSVRVATGSLEAIHNLPLPASLMDARAIATQPAMTADGALRGLPGFDRNRSNSMFTNYGQLRVSFSGAGNDRGLVLVDDVPAQDGFGGQIDWAAYPPTNMVRAELLRGVGSALYGSGAIGGVLSIQTFGPTSTTTVPQGTMSFGAGTHGFGQGFVQATAALSSKLSASFSAAQQLLQYPALAPGYQTDHDAESQAQASMASLRLRYAPTTSWVLQYGYSGAWDYQQEGRPNYDFWRRLFQNALTASHTTKQSTVTLGFYQRNAFVTNRADMFPSKPGTILYTQYVPTHESGAFADWIIDSDRSTFELLANGKFVGGVSDQYNGKGVFTVSGSGTQYPAGIAAQETLRIDRFQLIGGLRADAIDLSNAQTISGKTVTTIPNRVDRALSPRLAARYDLTKHLAIRASAGGGFRAPYLNELVRGYQIGAVKYLPNANLVPERSSSLGAGFDYQVERSELSLDFIHSYINNAIDFRTISPTIQMRSNFSHTQTDGATLVYAQNLSSCSRLTLSGTQQYARITVGTPAEIGKQLPYVPKASALASFDTVIGATQVGASVNYMGMTWADDLNQQPLGTAVVGGLHAAFPLRDGAALVFNADNVNNARYLSSIDRYGPPQVISLAFQVPVGSARPPSCSK